MRLVDRAYEPPNTLYWLYEVSDAQLYFDEGHELQLASEIMRRAHGGSNPITRVMIRLCVVYDTEGEACLPGELGRQVHARVGEAAKDMLTDLRGGAIALPPDLVEAARLIWTPARSPEPDAQTLEEWLGRPEDAGLTGGEYNNAHAGAPRGRDRTHWTQRVTAWART